MDFKRPIKDDFKISDGKNWLSYIKKKPNNNNYLMSFIFFCFINLKFFHETMILNITQSQEKIETFFLFVFLFSFAITLKVGVKMCADISFEWFSFWNDFPSNAKAFNSFLFYEICLFSFLFCCRFWKGIIFFYVFNKILQ